MNQYTNRTHPSRHYRGFFENWNTVTTFQALARGVLTY